MNDRELEFIRRQLQSALPPFRQPELQSDLWARMLRRMEEVPPRFAWWEAVLVCLIVAAFAVFPRLIPVMLYHL